jgi:hypothetical protein
VTHKHDAKLRVVVVVVVVGRRRGKASSSSGNMLELIIYSGTRARE